MMGAAGGAAGTSCATWNSMPDMVSRPKGHSWWWGWGSGGLDPGVAALLKDPGVAALLKESGVAALLKSPGVAALLVRGAGGRAA